MGVTDFLLLSCLSFAVTVQAQDCNRPVPGPNMNLKDDYILQETFPDGSKAVFACSVGYVPARGSTAVTCTAGKWSDVQLQCEKRSCGSAGEVENGQIDYSEGIEFGAIIRVSCNDGYRLVGRSQIRCGAKGWEDRLPRCEVVACDPPPPVVDATFSPNEESYTYGQVVRYSCKDGLTLNGSASISCSNNGTFKPPPPKCVRVQCPDHDVKNADWTGGSRPPYGHKASVTYQCRRGYKMIGNPTSICEINSQWSPKLPTCEPLTCQPPPVVANGAFLPAKENYTYHEVVQYSCQKGFRLQGSNSVSCSDDETFKPASPTCVRIQCEDHNIKNADKIGSSQPPYGYMDTVTYQCRTGYKMVGEPTQTCEINSQWSPGLPQCQKITCNRSPVMTGRMVSPDKESYQYDEVVQYSCEKGFILNGSKLVSCSDDGTFKPDPPTCIKIKDPVTKPTTPTTTTTPTGDSGDSGKVVGGVIGGILFAIIIGLIYYCCCLGKKKRSNDDKVTTKAEEEVALSGSRGVELTSAGNGKDAGSTLEQSPNASMNNV